MAFNIPVPSLLLPLLVSFLITIIATPVTITLAKRFKLVDDPKTRPHPAHQHTRVVPRAGGLPIFLSLVFSVLVFLPLDKHVIGIILATLVLLVMGLLDDLLTNFSPYPRLLLQILAAGIVVASGIGISFIANPLGGILRLDQLIFPFYFFGPHRLILIADIFAFLWIVWMMNMVNWSKGVDGQMPGIIMIASFIIGIFSYKLFLNGDPNQLSVAILAFVTAGASLGFLIFNWYPAKILPGFSASNILGLMIAVLSILSGAKLAIALLVLLVPAIDFFYTFFRRILSKKLPFYADKKHLHHILLERGWSHTQISLFYITSCAILGLAALNLSSEGKLFTVIGVGVVSLGVILWLHFFPRNLSEE